MEPYPVGRVCAGSLTHTHSGQLARPSRGVQGECGVLVAVVVGSGGWLAYAALAEASAAGAAALHPLTHFPSLPAQVDGCTAEMSDSSPYYQRRRICREFRGSLCFYYACPEILRCRTPRYATPSVLHACACCPLLLQSSITRRSSLSMPRGASCATASRCFEPGCVGGGGGLLAWVPSCAAVLTLPPAAGPLHPLAPLPQCAVLHPLACFEAERRSCISSLSKRMRRRTQGKRKHRRAEEDADDGSHGSAAEASPSPPLHFRPLDILQQHEPQPVGSSDSTGQANGLLLPQRGVVELDTAGIHDLLALDPGMLSLLDRKIGSGRQGGDVQGLVCAATNHHRLPMPIEPPMNAAAPTLLT